MNYEEIKKIATDADYVCSIEDMHQALNSAVDMIDELKAKLARVDNTEKLAQVMYGVRNEYKTCVQLEPAQTIQKYVNGE